MAEQQLSLRAFFEVLCDDVPENLWTTLVSIQQHPRGDARKLAAAAFCVYDIPAMLEWVEYHREEPGENLYVRPSFLTTKPVGWGRGKEEDTKGSTWLWADLDLYKTRTSYEFALQTLAAWRFPPTLTINSGGGLHVYWRLSAFSEHVSRMKECNSGIQQALASIGADGVNDYARILRIPATYNYKREPPVLTEVVSYHPAHIYDLETIWNGVRKRGVSKVSFLPLSSVPASTPAGGTTVPISAPRSITVRMPGMEEDRASEILAASTGIAPLHATPVSLESPAASRQDAPHAQQGHGQEHGQGQQEEARYAHDLPPDFLESVRKRDERLYQRIYSEETAWQAHPPINRETGEIDNSINDFYIASTLFALGVPADQVHTVLAHPVWFSGTKYREKGSGEGEKYVLLTIHRAREKQAQRDVSRYYHGTKFVPELMFDAIVESGAKFLLVGYKLWCYDSAMGVYYPDGEDYIKHEVAVRLGKVWRSVYATETINWCKAILYAEHKDEMRFMPPPQRKALTECWLNTRSGMLNLATRDVRDHCSEDKSLRQIPVWYDPRATSELLDSFVATTLPADCIDAWWEWVGYHFLEDCRFRKALMLIGDRMTGKSTLLDLLARFLGPVNKVSVPLQDICDDRFSASGLVGKLANIYNDLDMTELKKPGNMKMHIAGDPISVEEKHLPRYDAYLVAKHSYSANAFFPVADPDQAFITRWLVMYTPNQFEEGGSGDDGRRRANTQLIDALSQPQVLSAMLNRALDGVTRLLMQERFSIGASMIRAQQEFYASLDSIYAFLQAETEVAVQGFISKEEMLTAFRAYCISAHRSGSGSMSDKRFYMRINQYIREFGMHEQRKSFPGKPNPVAGYAGRAFVVQEQRERERALYVVRK